MDDIMYRTRYPRQTIQSRRKARRSKRGKDNKDTLSILQKIALQTVLCMFILAAVGIVKSIDTPVTNYLQDKIKGVLSYNIDIKGIFGQIDSAVRNAGNGNLLDSEDDLNSDVYSKTSDDTAVDEKTFDDESVTENSIYPSGENMVKSAEYSTNGEKDSDSTKDASEDEKKYSFIIPVGGRIGSFYGERVHPIKGTTEFHKGIDIEAQSGTPIKAASGGEVIEAGEEATFGKYIKIRHERNVISLYAHCSALLVKKGQSVDKGDVIARVGNTGVSQGPHLHFEVWEDEKHVDPLDYIQ
ncbi:MAG: M23 family metallopeptidase [Bacillota bacterium]